MPLYLKVFKEIIKMLKRNIFPTLRMKNIIIQGIRTQYNATLDGLKIEPEIEMINDITEIDIISL